MLGRSCAASICGNLVMRSSMLFRVSLAIATLFLAVGTAAAPYVPTDDAQVLERLPGRTTPQFRELKTLQVAAALAPSDLRRAVALATAYVRASRLEGDPRFLGYAEATLGPWWKDPSPPSAVLVLRATIRQSNHQFDAAVADLDKVLQRDPRNAQAMLTRATILTVQGKYEAARGDCETLYRVATEIYAVICSAAVDSLTGHAGPAYDALERALLTLPRIDDAARDWGETLLGEIAHRRGDPAAEEHFRSALGVGERDLYLLGAYCDWLLDEGRPADVVALLQNETRIDPLLLRLALAQKALGRPEASVSIEALRARFDASHARGDTVHQRENARFELFLRGDAKSALFYAVANWQVQREPADLRILAETAAASNDASALRLVRTWLADTGFEYPAVAALLGAGRLAAR
jgi:tetratricopeptide (TPR) repeat protein